MRKSNNPRVELAIAVLCLLTFFSIGVGNLKRFPIGNDEFNSWNHLQDEKYGTPHNIEETIRSVISNSEQHGPVYFVVLNLWQSLVGADLFSLRLLSLFFGLLVIALTYRLAASIRDQELGLIAILIIGFLAYQLYYGQLARMYTLLPLTSGWVLWSYWKVVHSAKTSSRWTRLSLLTSAALILYVHYFGIMILAAIGIYHLVVVEKTRRWLQVSLVMVIAGLLFLPWLPVAIEGFPGRPHVADTRLPLFGSLLLVLRIYSNGLIFIPLAAAALVAVLFRRLNTGEKFIIFVTSCILILTLSANEIAPIFDERQMRYMTVFAVPFSCALAIGLRLMPGWRVLRFPLLILWIASFLAFYSSESLLVYTNRRTQNLDKVPLYQDFIYESASLPGHNELILSFHPDTQITVPKIFRYYRSMLSKWSHLVHISYDEEYELVIQSGLSTFASVDAIAANANGIWVIHNPQQTDLQTMVVFTEWFMQHFQPCMRFLDKANSVVEYYLRSDVPCDLVTSESPLGIRYDNGTVLGNALVAQSPDELTVYVRWLQTLDEKYSFTLQVFDSQAEKVLQIDRVISGEPVDIVSLDISSLPAGEYSAKLIVYDFETNASQPGIVVESQQRFEREFEIARLTIGG